jgi:hypothetical protein
MTCTDRFFDGSDENNTGVDKKDSLAYHGGDFAGLTEKLDYLDKLGVNTIWITPIVENSNTTNDDVVSTGYHGYWASDFTKLNPYLGTEEEFKTLLTEAHNRDMKVMVDVVLNHAGYGMEDYFNEVMDDAEKDIDIKIKLPLLENNKKDIIKSGEELLEYGINNLYIVAPTSIIDTMYTRHLVNSILEELDMGNTKFYYIDPPDKINTLVDTLYTKIVLMQV